MSLTTFLLESKGSGEKKVIDTELDALFHSQERRGTVPNSSPVEKKKRRSDICTDETKNKRPKPSLLDVPLSSVSGSGSQSKGPRKRVLSSSKPVSEHKSSDTDRHNIQENVSLNGSGSESSGSEDESQNSSIPVHETLRKERARKQSSKKEKYSPSDETRERRDARTIFIGNLAPEIAVKRPLQKQLHRHILSFVPAAKIESTRFRSVAFQMPTTKLPDLGDEGEKNKRSRQHERDRASSWRDAHATDASTMDEKKFLTSSQKKKIAFINKHIHPDADSVHAYVVFAHPPPHARSANLALLNPIMDPFEAARLAVEKCNGTMFLDRMLRVDTIVKQSRTETLSGSALVGDPKLTVFVGNLDFASKEEDLRVFFEGVVSAERGPPVSDRNTSLNWVTRVRMIRDKDTQLGKGFAYVQFSDRTCVDEILAFEPGKLKFAKRKLRVQRCKSLPGASHIKNAPEPKPVGRSDRPLVPPIPKGDPSLGERLAQLSKEERRTTKAADADRVARRMAKKKARMALAKEGVPLQTKQRERVRKPSAKKHGGAPLKKVKKSRIRSERSIAKKNTKK